MESNESLKSKAVLYTVLLVFGLLLYAGLVFALGKGLIILTLSALISLCVIMIIYESIYEFLSYRNRKKGG